MKCLLAELTKYSSDASSTCVHYRFRCHAYLQLRQIVPKYVSVKTDDKRFWEMSSNQSVAESLSYYMFPFYCFVVIVLLFVFVYDESMPVN